MSKLPMLPLVGALPWLAASPLEFLCRAARSNGPMVDLGSVAGTRHWLAAHPEALQHVLQGNAANYVKGKGFEPMKILTGEGLVTAEGERWRRNRRMVQPAFHRQQVAGLTATMVEVAVEASDRWNRAPQGVPLDLAAEFTHLTRGVLMRAILGVQEPERVVELSAAWEDAFSEVAFRLLAPVAPPLSWPTPGNLRLRRALAVLDETAYDVVRQRRASGGAGKDLVSLLLSARDADTGAALTDQELRDEIMTFFAGGFETSAMALAWVFHLLGEHPEVEARVRAELATVLGDRLVEAEDVPRLPLLRAVVQETMRLYPGAWLLLRSNLAEDEVCGVRVAAGSRILVSAYATHRLPSLWDEPDAFRPERFLENAPARPKFAYLPFGGGGRQCIGDVFALTEVMVVAAVVLQRHRLRRAPGYAVRPKPGGALRPDRGPMMLLEPVA